MSKIGFDSKWLVLVPTMPELELLQFSADACVELCGFGPIAAAARTAGLIAEYGPQRIMLVGIAGGYGDEIGIGEAAEFSIVQSDGVGIGCGAEFVGAQDAGWKQYSPDDIGDRLVLGASDQSRVSAGSHSTGVLLTVCGAAADKQHADRRGEKYPDAIAEDMEGYGVALAAAISEVPVHVVRGISNTAGDRNHQSWQIKEALSAANSLAMDIMRSFDNA